MLIGALCGCCLPPFTHAAQRAALHLDEVAPGLFMRRGLDEDVSAQNENAIANIGFIVGRRGVAVFDPGGSRADGERLRAAIVAQTRLPIRYVILSHVHPDHVFGASAFERDRPEFVGHARLPRALSQRADYYRKRLEALLGADRAGKCRRPYPPRSRHGRDRLWARACWRSPHTPWGIRTTT